ncbi:LuxR family transcriptional regulator [Pseudooceanicola sp. CBS1P-1]|uniref:HTH luxR-type domain-containing protein n=1 Tax=Pseudooceanicola albus TaxID=2692189 RepID=A0A6L7GA67_9RHOB|nr:MULTISPECIES: autoinducer binding domain-containing protein [Pseudooceanicola]MBT9386653.1 LuxR family transcriptional regulator [Pseudooceanicola endophyticus]MXN20935.1 hypothetical protein [Pseudooceanicola albus]
MTATSVSHFDLAERFSAARTPDQIFATLEQELDQVGYGKYIYAQMYISESGQRSGYANRSTTDPEMRATYARERIFEADPLIDHAAGDTRPKFWSEIFDPAALKAMPRPYRRFSEVADGYGLRAGVTFRLEERPMGRGKLVTGVSLMQGPGVAPKGHDAQFLRFQPRLLTMLDHFRNSLDPSDVARDYYDLSLRERDVLGLTADGMQVQQIADNLGIADRTVAHHLGQARQKLFARTTSHAIAIALRAGLI